MSEQTPFFHTGVQCLTAIAQHHGLQVNPERLISDYALGKEEPTTLVMLRMAADIGLKAKNEAMTWEGLRAQDGVFPLIAYSRTGAMVIVVGMSKQESGADQVGAGTDGSLSQQPAAARLAIDLFGANRGGRGDA
jgi:ATP-binding cassette subfamily B protein